MVLATVPPTIGFPLSLSILVALALRGRWDGLAAFLVTLSVLILASFGLIGNWIPDYIEIVTAYRDYASITWVISTLNALPLQIAFVIAMLGFTLWVLWRFLLGHISLVELAITAPIVALLLLPQTGQYYLVLLIPAVIACLHRATLVAPDDPVRAWLVRLSCVLLIISPWLYPREEAVFLAASVIPAHMLVTWTVANGWLHPHSVLDTVNS